MASDWPNTQLGEVARLQRGLSYVAAQLRPPGRPFVTLKCFEKGGGFRWDGLKTFVGPAAPEYELQGGELLIANTDLTRDASVVGAPALAPRFDGEPAVFSMDVSRLVTDATRADNRFLAFRLATQDARSFMQARSGGSTVLHLQLRGVPRFQFQLPPLPEQRQIAAILDTLDETIRKTEQIIAKLKQVKQGLLHDLLTRGIDDNGELRDPERNPEQFKDSVLGRIPRGWEVGELERVLDGPPKNGHSPTAVAEWTGRLMLGLGCLSDEGFVPAQLKNAPRNEARLDAAVLRDGDLLLSRANTRDLVGLAGIYRDVGTPCTYPDLMMRLTPLAREATPEFLELVLRSPRLRRQIQAAAVGTSASMVKISGSIVRRLAVAIPSLAEQAHILARANSCKERALSEERRSYKLRLLKSGLMEDLLTGRVRVSIAEVAS